MQKIEGFFDRYRFLSNFVDAEVKYEGEIYPTTEHAYQAAKTLDLEMRKKIQAAKSAGTAKKLGKKVVKREDWDSVKEIVMTHLLLQKFNKPEYRDQLLATGDAYLEETNFWGDTYWGVCGGKGQNRLGHILMDIRQILQEEVEPMSTSFVMRGYKGRRIHASFSRTPLEIRGHIHMSGPQPVNETGGCPEWVADLLDQNPRIKQIAIGFEDGGIVYQRVQEDPEDSTHGA